VRPARLRTILQVVGLALAVVALVVTAQRGARERTLAAFHAYRTDQEDAQRLPVEALAVTTFDRLGDPSADPELAEAALNVLRRSASWFSLGPSVAKRLTALVDGHLIDPRVKSESFRAPIDLLVICDEGADAERLRLAVAARAPAHDAQVEVLTQASARLQESAGAPAGDQALTAVADAWTALFGADGRRLNWAARAQPAVVEVERAAVAAVAAHVRALLDPFGVKIDARYGDGAADDGMIAWLESQAETVGRARPELRGWLRRAVRQLARLDPDYHLEPVVAAAIASAVRQRAVPWSGLLVAFGVLAALGAGVWFSLWRLARGPIPVDVNAETMQNVEPIDLDTDADTRARATGTHTDVG
jgi:hypothetical protein